MEIIRNASFLTRLKRVISNRKFIVGLIALWLYSLAIYYLQYAEILMFRGVIVIVLLAVPLFFAMLTTVLLVITRFIG